MPPPPGMELSEPPPLAPRQLPKGYFWRKLLFQNLLTIIGTVFFVFGSGMTIAFLQANKWVSLIPGFFAMGGFFMLKLGIQDGLNMIRVYRHGDFVPGKVHSLSMDTTYTVNGRHPYKLTYHFQLGNDLFEGSISSFNTVLSTRRSGQPVWVLYLPDHVEVNTLYPAIK